MAGLYQQLPVKGRRPARGERDGPANTEGCRTCMCNQERGSRQREFPAHSAADLVTNLLDLRGLCYKVKATQKPMVFQSLCSKTSNKWVHVKNKGISATGTW